MKIYTFPSKTAEAKLRTIVKRDIGFRKKDVTAVTRIIEAVRKSGDDAVLDYSRRFDAPEMTLADMRVDDDEIKRAGRSMDRSFVRALNRAIRQIGDFHRRQVENSWVDTQRAGVVLGQLVNPVETAGIYVPGGQGGKTPLVSSVLMGAIPASIAGVERLVMVTPPTAEGTVDPHLLVAAHKVGITEIYKVGSAWAIAALAYGTDTIPRADVIVGPGNIYVTLAKKLVSGMVGIDMVAGPSEILILADESANAEFIAADLLSQAEHDELASAMLITTSDIVARTTAAALSRQLPKLPRCEIAAKSLEKFGLILTVSDLDTAFELANRIAPEHLELIVPDPYSQISRIRNAGAIFIGNWTPEPMGDYIAGPNHVLPTAGTARFASALSVSHFTKKTSLISYDRNAFKEQARDVIRLAAVEGLEAHAQSVKVRLKPERPSPKLSSKSC